MAFANAVRVTPIRLEKRAAVSVATMVSADGTDGNKFTATSRTLLRVKNTDASPITVTINTNATFKGLTLPDATFSAPATTGDVVWSGFEEHFHQNAAADVHVEFSAVAGVTLAVYEVVD